MKYIKKEEFRNLKQIMSDESGRYHTINTNVIEDESIYNNNKHMFDEIEEDLEVIDIVVEETVVEVVEEEPEKKSVKEQIEEINEKNEEDLKQEIFELVDQCSTVDDLHELADQYNVNIDKRKKNIKKIKDEFKEELVITV